MSTADEIRQELTALEAQRDRLLVVDLVLTDILAAANATARTKRIGDGAAEQEKLQHWDSVTPSVWEEQHAVGQRWREAHDRLLAEITSKTRRGIERSR
ncbi:hypothetical protein ACQP1O_33170 [Nocardia sp. CA-151230]|uniref:hypothetical protein n=1 Tax=Nocardia sp. CA-151230 TaxID=3239982 RepID=UPI003D91EAF3